MCEEQNWPSVFTFQIA